MSWFTRLRNLFRSDDLSSDIDREMQFHLAERTDDLVARGMDTDAARHEARRRFGNYGTQKERTRERDVLAFLDSVASDLHYSFRTLRRAPAFALVAVLSLGLGIGANTAIFTLINTVLLKALPVNHPEELVLVRRGGSSFFTNPLWEGLRDRQDVFRGVAAYETTAFNLAQTGEVRRTYGNFVSGDFFPMLGVQAAIGRLISRADDFRGCPAIAVIGGDYWATEYGGRSDIIGQTITLDGKPFPIIGVVEPNFSGVSVGTRTNVYVPLCAEAVIRGNGSYLDRRSTWFLQILARPKPELTPAQVQARLAMLSPEIARVTLPPNWTAAQSNDYLAAKFSVSPAANGDSPLRAQYRTALWVLMAVVALVLLIACANVANLLLARAMAREREMAVRLALGAGRGRLVRQLLTESVLLSLIGAIVGTLLASWGTRLLVRMMTARGQILWLDLSIDIRILSFTIAIATATGMLFGLVPAWRSRRVDPHSAMKSHGRGLAEGHSRFSMGKALVTAQIALSLVLLAGAGLLLGSWRRLATANAGFRSEGILVVTVGLGSSLDSAQRTQAYEEIGKRLRAAPGIVTASMANVAPFGGSSWNDEIQVAGFSPASELDAVVWMNAVTPGYFTTMATPFVAGRDFNAADSPASPQVAIVNEALVRKFFGSASPLGRQFHVREGRNYGEPIRVVGVVKNTKYRSMRESDEPIAYLPLQQSAGSGSTANFVIRVAGDATLAIPSARSLLTEAAPRASLRFFALERQISESLRLPRTLATLSGFFGALALVLAAIGLYGIMSYSVARRRNEIGVRIALGAAQSRVVRLVLGEVSRMVVVGVLIGTGLALAATKLVVTFLYGVTASDPITLAGSAAVLVMVALGAALIPARRAARLDPVEALREE